MFRTHVKYYVIYTYDTYIYMYIVMNYTWLCILIPMIESCTTSPPTLKLVYVHQLIDHMNYTQAKF